MPKRLPRSMLAAALASLFLGACATWDVRHNVRNGDLAGVRSGFEKDRNLSPESPDECGWTLLHYASYYQHTPIVDDLLARGADVNACTTAHSNQCIPYSHIPAGSTPLVIAAYYGQADILLALLARGADPTVKNAEGYDALTYARKFDFSESVRALERAATRAP